MILGTDRRALFYVNEKYRPQVEVFNIFAIKLMAVDILTEHHIKRKYYTFKGSNSKLILRPFEKGGLP